MSRCVCQDIQDWNVVQTDVRQVDFRPFEGKVELVSGGPPCQPFSMGGKGLAFHDGRNMFPEAVRAVREARPRAFIFENVRGLLRKSFASYFNYIILQLTYPDIVAKEGMDWMEHLAMLEKCHTSKTHSSLKYNVTYRLVNAADYGVPQQRFRVIIVGFREDVDARWAFPSPTHSAASLAYAQWVTGSYWEEHGMSHPSMPCPYTAKQLEKLRAEGNGLFAMRRWRTVRDALHGLPDPESEANHVDGHTFRGWAKSYAGHSGSALDQPSKTIKAGAHGVPGGENTVVLDDGRIRYYTIREAARIQTFPDEVSFSSSWGESMRQIGNAVPVALGRVVGASVAKLLS